MFMSAWRSMLSEREAEQRGDSHLRLVEAPTAVLAFPHNVGEIESAVGGRKIELIAEVRTKHYPVVGVAEERFHARLQVDVRTPVALMEALTTAMSKVESLCQAPAGDEPLILELRLRAV